MGAVVVTALILATIWYLIRRRRLTLNSDDNATTFANTPSAAPRQNGLYISGPFRAEKSQAGTLHTHPASHVYTTPSSAPSFHISPTSTSEGSTLITETSRGRVPPPLRLGAALPGSPASETDRVAVRLDEAVAEIANLRGELRSLRGYQNSAWTSHPSQDMSPPSYDYGHNPR